jgi:uroporphyrinogen decarboxylase
MDTLSKIFVRGRFLVVHLLLTITLGLNVINVDATTTVPTSNDPLLLRAARGEFVERTPVWMMRQAGRHMQAYRDLCAHHPTFRQRSELCDVAAEISLQPWRAYHVDGVILFSDILTPLPAMGCDFDVSDDGKIDINPIRTRQAYEEIKDYNFNPRESLPFVGETLTSLRSTLKDTDTTLLGFIGLPFTILTYLIEGRTGTVDDFAATRAMLFENPELVDDLLDLLAHRLADYAVYQVESGAQMVQLFDSWAGWLSPDEYDRWAKPYQAKVVALLKERVPSVPLILYMAPLSHSRQGAYLERMAEIGVDVVSIDHTISLQEARRRLDAAGFATTTIQGNLDPKLLCHGPKQRIVDETKSLLRTFPISKDVESNPLAQKPFRRHIMNLGHGIEKDTPESHASLFVETVRRPFYDVDYTAGTGHQQTKWKREEISRSNGPEHHTAVLVHLACVK